MKKRFPALLLVVLMLCTVLLSSCQSSAFTITVDQNGLASWQPIKDATAYRYMFVDGENISYWEEKSTTECTLQLPEGFCLHLRPVFADGSTGNITMSDFYGEPLTLQAINAVAQQPLQLSMDENRLLTWEAPQYIQSYNVRILDALGNVLSEEWIQEPSCHVPEGCQAFVYGMFINGSIGPESFTEAPVIPTEAAKETTPEVIAASTPEPEEQPLRVQLEMDENGLVSWQPLEDVEYWDVCYLKNGYANAKTILTKDTFCQLPLYYGALITPVFKDGSRGETVKSEVYGGQDPSMIPALDLTGCEVYDLIPAIDPTSFTIAEDGVVTFTAMGPDGSPMRYEGQGITLTENGLCFAPDADIMGLDAIGTIIAAEPAVSANESEENFFSFRGGYEPFGKRSAESAFHILPSSGFGHHVIHAGKDPIDLRSYGANFIGFQANSFNPGSFTLSSLKIYYTTDRYHTPIREIALDPAFYGTYLEGEAYALDKEGLYSIEDNLFTFRLLFLPDTPYGKVTEDYHYFIGDVDKQFFTVGDLKDKNGTVLDKTTAIVEDGVTLTVTIGSYTCDVALPLVHYYRNARTLHDLLPHATLPAEGNVNVLAVPIAWQEETHTQGDASMLLFQQELGRVSDMDGNVTDHSQTLLSDKQRFSLSSYYDQASYGKLHITSFLTDWYPAPCAFPSVADTMPDTDFLSGLLSWLYRTYPDLDWSLFDQDGNGYIDSLMLLNDGDVTGRTSFLPASFAGGVRTMLYYTPEGAGTQYRPAVNDYTVCHSSLFDTNVLVHEFGHSLGLVDYYDVTYSGINALGNYDMQSGSYGDWNAYSKYAAGWIDPIIVTGLQPGESREYTIGSMSLTGDAIVIPAAEAQQDGTPFNEYILIDLFTPEGVHRFDAAQFGLENAKGVRIYHVNAAMERRELTYDMAGDTVFPIGTIHVANDYKEPDRGQYHIELIQRGGNNTFTDLGNLRTQLTAKDLFRQGDRFTLQKYKEFFFEGKMDDGLPFGYTVDVVSIRTGEDGQTTATIRVTRDQ